MTLGTHAAVGIALASVVPAQPVWAFVIGFGSHLVLDSIPHWDYHLDSLEKNGDDFMKMDIKLNKHLLFDAVKMGADLLLGLAVGIAFFVPASAPYVLLAGAIGAVLPDFLHFVYSKFRHPPISTFERFHLFMHAKDSLNDQPRKGIAYQVIIVAALFLLAKLVA